VATAGCGSIDPTTQSVPVTFQDNLHRGISLSLCADSSCRSFDYTDQIAAGATDRENISDRDLLTRWRVADSSGRTLGCIPLEFTGKYKSIAVRLSQMVHCPGTYPLSVRHGRKTSGEV
jgi:hypothetical protein